MVVVDELLPFPVEIQFLIQCLTDDAEHQRFGEVTGNAEGRQCLVFAFASGGEAGPMIKLGPVRL